MKFTGRSAVVLCLWSACAAAVATACSIATQDSRGTFASGEADPASPEKRGVDSGAVGSAAVAAKRGSLLCRLTAQSCDPDKPSCNAAGPDEISIADAGSRADGGRGSLAPATTTPDAAPRVTPGEGDAGGAPLSDAATNDEGACRLAGGDRSVRFTCGLSGAGIDGDRCTTGDTCQAGFDCIRPATSEFGVCRHYCCSGICAAGNSGSHSGNTPAFCDIQFAGASGLKVPVCMPVKTCKLLSVGACGSAQTCAVVRDNDGTTGCVDLGPAAVGQSCEEVHCGVGLTCLGVPGTRKCSQLCSKELSCPTGERCLSSPPTFKEPGVGICVNTMEEP